MGLKKIRVMKANIRATFVGQKNIFKNLTSSWAPGLASCTQALEGGSGSGQFAWSSVTGSEKRRGLSLPLRGGGGEVSDSDCPSYCIFYLPKLGHLHLLNGINETRLVRIP